MKFAYIAPIQYLHLIPQDAKFHLLLAHLLDNKDYVEFYNRRHQQGDYILLDNGAFEFKRPLKLDEILSLIDKHNAEVDTIVAPDYPYVDWPETVQSAMLFKNELFKRNLPYKMMVVPQSITGDVAGFFACYSELAKLNPEMIGMSILGIPNAFCEKAGTKDIMFNRIYATIKMIKMKMIDENIKHHYLGLGLPREILLQQSLGVAYSNDSSSPFWHGINGIRFDGSYGALVNGKIQKEVDFFIPYDKSKEEIIKYNINKVECWRTGIGE